MFKRSYLGIDIGSVSIKLANSPVNIMEPIYGIAETPPGSFEDGYIRDIPTMAEAITQCLQGKDKFRGRNVVFSILSSDVIIRDMSVPSVPAGELPQLVRNMAQEYIPASLKEYVIDYKTVGMLNEGETQKQRLLLFAAPIALIDGYLELADKIKSNLAAVDVYQNCIIKADKLLRRGDYGNYLILDMGGMRSAATFFRDKSYAFSKLFDFGGEDITRLISDHMGIPRSEAEYLKKNYTADDGEMDMSSICKSFADELIRYVDYYISRYDAKGLEKVILIGGSSGFHPLREYISECLDLDVTAEDSFMPEPYGMIFNALGASMREGRE